MKKTDGISLISLIVTIVLIIILATIAIFNGLSQNIDETVNTMDYNEIFEVAEAVAQRALLNKLNSEAYELVGKEGTFTVTHKEEKNNEIVEVKREYSSADGWVMLEEEHSKELNLDKVRRKYIVNYKTSEVISLETIYYDKKPYHVASNLKDAIGGGSVIVSANRYDEAKGVNKPFVVSGMIPVKWNGNSWIVTNVDDDEWYDYASFNSDEAGVYGNLWANVMLMDELEVYGMDNSDVRNSSLSALEGKEVTKEGSMYVWIPRYSRGIIDSETKIVYSKLTKDYFPDSDVLEAFRENGVDLTGIWVSKYDAGYIER